MVVAVYLRPDEQAKRTALTRLAAGCRIMSDSIDSCIDSKKALVARPARLLFGQSILRRIFYRDGVDGYKNKTFNYFRPK